MELNAGIVISASHNPFEDNGLKIFTTNGFKPTIEQELEIERYIFSEDLERLNISPLKLGRVCSVIDPAEGYIEFLLNSFPKGYTLKGLRLVIDCANGAAYRIAPEVFVRLGADVITLFNKPDGRNINRGCGTEHPEILKKEVVKYGANLGLAFDGDGDRVLVIDEVGDILTGDHLIAISAVFLKNNNRLPHNSVVTTIMSNKGLGVTLQEHGIRHLTTDVGDRNVVQMMIKEGAALGGEISGHLIFLEHHTTGDGILSALQILSILIQSGKPLSELAKIMRIFPQYLINVNVKNKPDLSGIPEILDVIDTIESRLGKMGRVLVRYSGTQPMCRVMVEGPTHEEVERYSQMIADVIKVKLN